MRLAPKSGPRRNIREVEIPKKNGKGETMLWQVHFTFKGDKTSKDLRISQSFSYKKCGGKEQALVQAQRFRNPYGVTAGELVQRLRDHVAVSCWHANERESAAMWKLYSKSNEAVCVQSTFRKLNNAVRAVAQVGVVRYVDYETSWIPESNPLAPFIYKRLSFEHEREIRAIIPPKDVTALLAGKATQPGDGGHWVPVELTNVIERILVAPDAPAWLAALVRRVTDHYQFNSIPVVPSTLGDAPFY